MVLRLLKQGSLTPTPLAHLLLKMLVFSFYRPRNGGSQGEGGERDHSAINAGTSLSHALCLGIYSLGHPAPIVLALYSGEGGEWSLYPLVPMGELVQGFYGAG